MKQGLADICFLAIDPAREDVVGFTAPCAVIEPVLVVPEDAPIHTLTDVDRPGLRVGVEKGSAYDLFLTCQLTHADVVRGSDGVALFSEQHLEVAAGIRQPASDFAARHHLRVVEPPFMQIRQAVGTTRTRREATLRFLCGFVEDLNGDGFIAASLRRSGRGDAAVAPPL
jgi:polar amino acid transport system substrate-binding protein